MITRIRIVNFKQMADETIELGQAVVLIGPNNGGKSSLLQAISLFGIAVRAWAEQRHGKKSKAVQRTGVAINLEQLLNIPVGEFRELWRDLDVRVGMRNEEGKSFPKNIMMEIHAEGFTDGVKWSTGFEFDYGRDTLMYARLTKDSDGNTYEFPEELLRERIGYLPSISGLSATEDKYELGSIFRRIGEGRTSEVLRNICHHLYDRDDKTLWNEFVDELERLFKVKVNPPRHNALTGLLTMTYNEGDKKEMGLASLGSGTKQAILLLAYLRAFPNTINLLDEPDAHLEVIRQAGTYDRISDLTKRNNSQLIVASHSESVLNRAFGKDLVISTMFGHFEVANEEKHIRSVLRNYGYEEYIIAKQRPHILYFEGTTDLDFIKAFCQKLGRSEYLSFLNEHVYPYPVGNDVSLVRNHFDALRKFIPELKGFALFDNLRKTVEQGQKGLIIYQWQRNEMENYLPVIQVSLAWADANLGATEVQPFRDLLFDSIPRIAHSDPANPYWVNTKISDDLLTPLFRKFLSDMGYPLSLMDKSKFYQLIDYADPDLFNAELTQVLDNMFRHLMGK